MKIYIQHDVIKNCINIFESDDDYYKYVYTTKYNGNEFLRRKRDKVHV